MRPLILSAAAGLAWAAAAAAPPGRSDDSAGVSQLPVGQVYKQFEFPYYQAGQLKFVLTAADATGITINRADTHDLKIDLYTNGKVTTTITSPDADLYVADRKMRTRHTVRVDRADLTATSQFCDFDLVTKQYVMRDGVKVTLLHFDAGHSMSNRAATGSSGTSSAAPVAGPPPESPVSIPRPFVPPPPSVPNGEGDSMIDSPGAYSSTNAAPLPLPQ